MKSLYCIEIVWMLVKFYICDIDSMLKFKSKITVANNDLSIIDFLKLTLHASRKWSLQKTVNAYCKPCTEVKKKKAVLKRKNVMTEKDNQLVSH